MQELYSQRFLQQRGSWKYDGVACDERTESSKEMGEAPNTYLAPILGYDLFAL